MNVFIFIYKNVILSYWRGVRWGGVGLGRVGKGRVRVGSGTFGPTESFPISGFTDIDF